MLNASLLYAIGIVKKIKARIAYAHFQRHQTQSAIGACWNLANWSERQNWKKWPTKEKSAVKCRKMLFVKHWTRNWGCCFMHHNFRFSVFLCRNKRGSMTKKAVSVHKILSKFLFRCFTILKGYWPKRHCRKRALRFCGKRFCVFSRFLLSNKFFD